MPTDAELMAKLNIQVGAAERRVVSVILMDSLYDLEAASGKEVVPTGIPLKSTLEVTPRRGEKIFLFVRGKPVPFEVEYEESPDVLYNVVPSGKKTYESPYAESSGFTKLGNADQDRKLKRTMDALETLLEQTSGIGRHLETNQSYALFEDIGLARDTILQKLFESKTMAELSLDDQFKVRNLALERVAYNYAENDLKAIIAKRTEEAVAGKIGTKGEGEGKYTDRLQKAHDKAEELKKSKDKYTKDVKNASGTVVSINITETEYKTAEDAIRIALEGNDGQGGLRKAQEDLRRKKIESENLQTRLAAIPNLIANKNQELQDLIAREGQAQAAGGTPEEIGTKVNSLRKQEDKIRDDIRKLESERDHDIPIKQREIDGFTDAQGKRVKGELGKLEDEVKEKRKIWNERKKEFKAYTKKEGAEYQRKLGEEIDTIVEATARLSDKLKDCYDVNLKTAMLSSFDGFRQHLGLTKEILSDYQLGEAIIRVLNLSINPQLLNSPTEQALVREQILTALRAQTPATLANDVVYKIIDHKLAAAEQGNPEDIAPVETPREWYREIVQFNRSREALIQNEDIPGINCIKRTFEIDGKRYAVVAKNGENQLVSLDLRDDGSYKAIELSSLGTRATSYSEGVGPEIQTIRNRIFFEVQYDSLVSQMRAGNLNIPGGDPTHGLSFNAEGEIMIAIPGAPSPERLRDYLKREPNSQDAQALATLGRTELQTMEDLSIKIQTLEEAKHKTILTTEANQTVIESVHYQNPNFRIVFEISESGIKVRGQDKNPTNNTWGAAIPLNTGLAPELSLDQFLSLDAQDPDAFRRRTLSGIFNQFASLTPQERVGLNVESIRVDLGYNDNAGNPVISRIECGIDENGEFYVFNVDDPTQERMDLIEGLESHERKYNAFTSYDGTNADTIKQSVLENPVIEVQSLLAKRYLEALQRRMTIH